MSQVFAEQVRGDLWFSIISFLNEKIKLKGSLILYATQTVEYLYIYII